MPLPNTRIVIQGVPRAEKEFEVVEVSAREAQRLARALKTDTDRAKREIQNLIRGPAAR